MKIMTNIFDDIRPYYESEIPDAVSRIIESENVSVLLDFFLKKEEIHNLIISLKTVESVDDFQRKIMIPIIEAILQKTSKGIFSKGIENVDLQKNYLFITNHRDIALDSVFLNYILLKNNYPAAEIAIGNNLLIKPWITDLVRINKSFIVKRNIQGRELFKASKILSRYIRYAITEKKSSVWMAQREGRAKDGNDLTQASLIKMMAMSNTKTNFIESFNELNILPVSITYEYDPCDVFKAKELYLIANDPNYRKTPDDDLMSMKQGILGDKGRICYSFDTLLNYDGFNEVSCNNDLSECISKKIDSHIHKNYNLFPTHYIALDIISKYEKYKDRYTKEERDNFIDLLKYRLEKIHSDNINKEDIFRLTLEQYANIARNKLRQG